MPSCSESFSLCPIPLPRLQRPTRIFAGTSGWAYPTWKPDFYPAKAPRQEVPRVLRLPAQLRRGQLHLPRPAHGKTRSKAGSPQPRPTSASASKHPSASPTSSASGTATPTSPSSSTRSAPPPIRQTRPAPLPTPPNFPADPIHLSRIPLKLSKPVQAPPIAFEFRHESCFTEEIYNILRLHNASLCIAESDDLTTPEVHTAATHTSFRLRRNGGYTPAEIRSLRPALHSPRPRPRRLRLLQARRRPHRRPQRHRIPRKRTRSPSQLQAQH